MTLYEVTNGYQGESYVRIYAWASSEEEAQDLAWDRFFEADQIVSVRSNLKVKPLFSAAAKPFATKPSDSGWEA